MKTRQSKFEDLADSLVKGRGFSTAATLYGKCQTPDISNDVNNATMRQKLISFIIRLCKQILETKCEYRLAVISFVKCTAHYRLTQKGRFLTFSVRLHLVHVVHSPNSLLL